MAEIDLRAGLNAISDVVNNRPRPLREFDQIFMKTADMLLQTEHVSRLFEGKRVVFIGDGDAIGLCLVHLHNMELLERGPKSVHVLDFDECVVFSIRAFAERFGISERISAELYNVARRRGAAVGQGLPDRLPVDGAPTRSPVGGAPGRVAGARV
jgi:predicted methyltransferase